MASQDNDDAYAFVLCVGRLEHSGDDGWTPPDDADDVAFTLDGLIAQAREIMATRRFAIRISEPTENGTSTETREE